MVTRSIESAQRKVEARNFDIRKQLLEYDDVANDQRKTIYALRNEVLESQDVSPRIADLRAGVIADMFRVHIPEDSVEEQWDVAGLENALKAELNLELPLRKWLEDEPELDDADAARAHRRRADAAYREKVPAGAEPSFRQYERYVMLQILDAPLARAPRRARPSAPGHPPARLRAEEPEAGVQARGVRAVRRDGRGGQAGGGQDADRGARSAPRTTCRRPTTSRTCRTSSCSTAAPPRGEGECGRRRAEEGPADGAPHAEGRPQRSLPLRLGEEIQALPRQADLAAWRSTSPHRTRAHCIPYAASSSAWRWPASRSPAARTCWSCACTRAPRSPACSRRTASAPRRCCWRRSTWPARRASEPWSSTPATPTQAPARTG